MRTNEQKLELTNWKFQIDQEDIGESFGWHLPDYYHHQWMNVNAPGAWDFYELAMRNYEGVGWYYSEIPTFSGELIQHILSVTGIGGRAWVWVNGKLAGTNAIRYLPFIVNIQAYLHPGEKNIIVIKVNNCFQGEHHLPGGNKIEWVLYGGLIHKIHLIAAPLCRIEHMDIKTDCFGKADVMVTVRNDGSNSLTGMLCLKLETNTICEAQAYIQCNAGQMMDINLILEAESFIPWSPERPVLYILTAELNDDRKVMHMASMRIGFRTIECKGQQILLNGEPIIIKGVNRYDEYHPYGSSAPERLIYEDLKHIKRCGVNLIRVHYPQDPIHLDIADEIGILYMLEVPLNWWKPKKEDILDHYSELREEVIETMDRTYQIFGNHPSWIIWSMSNECEYHNNTGISLVRMLADRARRMRCDRLITSVINDMPNGKELDFCDFIGINIYHGGNKPVRRLVELISYITEPTQRDLELLTKLYPEKPIVICEFGCLSIKGLMGGGRMSEDRHNGFLKYSFKAMRESKNVRGTILWAWADYYHNRDLLVLKPGFLSMHTTFGPYGVVTADRRIKDGPYQALIEIYSQDYQNDEVLYRGRGMNGQNQK